MTSSQSKPVLPTYGRHTEGPWFSAPAGQRMRAACMSHAVATADMKQVVAGCFEDVSGGEDEAEANARLIAACPDFFASAKDLIEAWDARTTRAQQIITGKSDADLQKQAMAAIEGLRAAITKATTA